MTEPNTYSIKQFKQDGKTVWNGVRNFQARNFLKQVQLGDRVWIYHSGEEKALVGLAEVIREAYLEESADKGGGWVQVDLKFCEEFETPLGLATLKTDETLRNLVLVKQSRLSVSPVTPEQCRRLQNFFQSSQK